MIKLPVNTSADWKSFDKGNHMFSNVTIAIINFHSTSIVCEIGCHLNAINNYFYSPNHSAINISESHALLDNCIFQQNCLLKVEAGSWVSVRDSEFNLLHNTAFSCIAVYNSTVVLSGEVKFTDNSLSTPGVTTCAAAIYVNNTGSLIISRDA